MPHTLDVPGSRTSISPLLTPENQAFLPRAQCCVRFAARPIMMAMIYLVWIWRLDLVIHRFINALNSLSSGEQRNRTPEHWVSQRHLGGLGSVQWRQLRGSLQADWGQGQVLHLQDCGSTTQFLQGCSVCGRPHLRRRAQVKEVEGLADFPHCARAQRRVSGMYEVPE